VSFRHIAVPLAERGYSVFPLRERGKEPLTPKGLHDSTRDERQILHWDNARPGANPGLNLQRSNGFVVDVDPKHGVDPESAIAAFHLDEGIIVFTGEAPEPDAEYPNSLSGVRGVHAYFKGHCRTGKTGVPGVEIRGDGAYVVAPGSAHPSGVLYVGDLPPADELPDPPATVRELIRSMPQISASIPEDGAIFEPGERHEALLAWCRSRYVAHGVLGEALLVAMLGKNATACKPPLPEDEVRRLFRSLDSSRIAQSERAKAVESASANGGARGQLFTTRGVDLKQLRPVRFIWRPWLVRGRLNLLVGEEGAGKSALQAWIVAELTHGRLPGDLTNGQARILYVPADEDDWYEVVTPRLYAQGVKLDRVHEFTPANESAVFNAVTHIRELERELRDGHFHFVVFEQLMDVMPRLKNPNDPMEVRQALKPLRRCLNALGVTGLGTLHRNKGQHETLRQAMQGSMQFGALSRSTSLVAWHPSEEGRRVAVLGKANYTGDYPAMGFRIESDKFDLNGRAFDVAKVVDVSEEDLSVADVLGSHRERERPRDTLATEVATVLTSEPQRLSDLARMLGREPSDQTLRRALAELSDLGLAEKVGRGLWRQLSIVMPLRGVTNDNSHRNAVFGPEDED
jgi:hypothetical protein